MSGLTRRSRVALACCALGVAATAHAQDLAATLGMQRAAKDRVEWGIRESSHPALGDIRFAYMKVPVETAVGGATIYSRAYVSCQKGLDRFAIELFNATTPTDPMGLRQAAEPRLTCVRPTGPGEGDLAREELLATWEAHEKLGVAITRGLRGFPLRECVAIGVAQEVALPAGLAQKTARIEFEILPYGRELDSIFAGCGERSAYAAASVAPPAPRPSSAPAKAADAEAPWQKARVVAIGKTNVRAQPSLQSAIVAQLAPGAAVLVQRAGNDWWRAKPAKGAGFEGYIREDRLVFK